jgi:hypothetical protein
MHIVLIICAILFGAFWVANAAIMLVSPKWWFKISVLDGFRGTMTERKYGNARGHLQVRALGAIFLAASLLTIYDMISN